MGPSPLAESRRIDPGDGSSRYDGSVCTFILGAPYRPVVPQESALEVRVEVYCDGDLPSALSEGIGRMLAERWPAAWDVKVPPRPSRAHPAEWRAVVPISSGASPESLHRQLVDRLLALDPAHSLHLRTRWASQESPDHQEVYEERWSPGQR